MVTHNIEEAVLMADRIVVMDKDPGHVVADLPVHLRQPRKRKDTAFQALVDKVYAAVAGHTEPEAEVLGTAPGQPGSTEKLPAGTAARTCVSVSIERRQCGQRMSVNSTMCSGASAGPSLLRTGGESSAPGLVW